MFRHPDPRAPPPRSWVCFQLWRLCSSKASLGPANAISAKSSDIKYNRGERSRKSYRAGMNSFPFELVPFSFNLLLSASSWPESSLCFSSTPEGSGESAARWPHLYEPNTCSVLQVLQSIPPCSAAGLSLIHFNTNTTVCCHGTAKVEINATLKEAAVQNRKGGGQTCLKSEWKWSVAGRAL